MSILRNDVITNTKVIIAENRSNRPFDIDKEKKDLSKCPFCPGNEEKTPPHLCTNGLPWTVRIVPNKYSALNKISNNNKDGLFSYEGVTGSHYVIIDSDKHYNYLHEMKLKEISDLLYIYSWLMIELYKDPDVKYVQIFKNYKKEGGSSLEHTHSQAIALSTFPEKITKILEDSKNHYEKNKECVFCKIIEEEINYASRVILESEYFIAFAPYASMFPYEVCIYPKIHKSNFTDMTKNEYWDLSQLLKDVLLKIYTNLNNPAYNLFIHSINEATDYFHWNIRIIPRTNIQAGFELSTGIMLNPISPEQTKLVLSK